MDATMDAIDAMSKVAKILDFLSSEVKNPGLSFILDACCQDLVQAGIDLEVATNNEMPEA